MDHQNRTKTKTLTLNVSTDQEAYDAVVRHLREQSRQAFWDGACVYKADDGRKCAVGCLLASYDPRIEGMNIGLLVEAPEDVAVDLGDVSLQLLRSLQHVHDSNETWSNSEKAAWVSDKGIAKLRYVAWTYGLSDAIIDQVFVYKTGNEVSGLRD